MQKATNNDGIPIIVDLRGIAALGVCLYHFICTVIGFTDNHSVIYNIFVFGQKGVQLFFVISSVVIAYMLIKINYDKSQFIYYIKKRLLRIYPPFVGSALILFLMWTIRNSYMSGYFNPDTKVLLSNLFFIAPFVKIPWLNNIFWTLSVEMGYYLFMGILFDLALKNFFSRIIFYLSFILVFSSRYIFNHSHLFNYWAIYFLPGIVYMLWKYKKISSKEMIVVFVIASVPIIFIYGWLDYSILACTLLLIHYLSDFSLPELNFLGEISYSLYITHVFTGMIILNIFSKYCSTGFEKFLLLFIALSFTILCAYFFYKWIESPFHRVSKNINQLKFIQNAGSINRLR